MADSVFGLGPEFRAPVRRREGPRSPSNAPFSTPFRAGQFGVAGSPVTPERGRVGAVPVGVIDGPYDAGALAGILMNPPTSLGAGSCSIHPNSACKHGTFVVGLLGARPNAPIPGLCPNSKILHVPLFVDQGSPQSSVVELANAIRTAVRGGARLINLSLAVLGDGPQYDSALAQALDEAEASGAVIVVAAGNQGRMVVGQLLSHPVTIPVVAVDAAGRLLPDCNFGPSIARRGVAALGSDVLGYAPLGGITLMSGTSVATAVATGILAQLWSAYPNAGGADLRAAVNGFASRHGPVPPVLEPSAVRALLAKTQGRRYTMAAGNSYAILQGATTMSSENGLAIPVCGDDALPARLKQRVTPAHGEGGCACGAPGGICTCGPGQAPLQPIYVLGSVDILIPNQSVSEELQSVALALSRAYPNEHLQEPRPTEELRAWQFRVLSKKEARYIARQMYWILKIEGHPAYYLSLRDLHDLDDLIRCLGRSEKDDLDLFVGSSNLVSVDTFPGVSAPLLLVDQLEVLTKSDLMAWFGTSATAPPKTLAKLAPVGQNVRHQRRLDELFGKLGQNADNRGDTDELRALNYLAARYKPLYELYAEIIMGRTGWKLDGIRVVKSRLSHGDRRLVDPIFTFRERATGDVEQYFLRVDVSYLFPMIIRHIDEYFER